MIRKALLGLACLAVFPTGEAFLAGARPMPAAAARDEAALLAETFRIDIRTISVRLTYHPESEVVDGEAALTFVMRPGQIRPLVHFDPQTRGASLSAVRLDREPLDPGSTADVRIIEFAGTTQKAVELQRDLDPAEEHYLEMSYSYARAAGYPRFTTEVDDLYGDGNEEIFPTLNSPEELARHEITFVVDSPASYRCIGSGWVRQVATQPQTWILDTEREVASYTVFFALLPESDTVLEEYSIAGIPVRIMAFQGGASPSAAVDKLQPMMAKLVAELGPFPMPRGLSVFLVSNGGGMEYFGGTLSSVGALQHEVTHMYFGCSLVARTYRDSWWDEAATSWYQQTYQTSFSPPPAGFRSNMVSGRRPIGIGFDRRAYFEGANVIEAMARQVGGRAELTRFFQLFHQTQAFIPFGTMDLVEFFRLYSGCDMSESFRQWLYQGEGMGLPGPWEPGFESKAPDWTPPPEVRRRYELSRPSGQGGRP
jgi:aminopeptidase N